jgi:hypothetical protein
MDTEWHYIVLVLIPTCQQPDLIVPSFSSILLSPELLTLVSSLKFDKWNFFYVELLYSALSQIVAELKLCRDYFVFFVVFSVDFVDDFFVAEPGAGVLFDSM